MFQHSQLAIASEPLLFLFLAGKPMSRCSWESMEEWKCCGKDTIQNRDYKSNQTQSDENDEKIWLKRPYYWNQQHSFVIACDNYHLFRLELPPTVFRWRQTKEHLQLQHIKWTAEKRNHLDESARVLSSENILCEEFWQRLPSDPQEKPDEKPWLPGFTGFTWSSTCVHLKGTVVQPLWQGSSEPMLRTSETWLRAGTKSSMKTWDKDIMCWEYPRK